MDRFKTKIVTATGDAAEDKKKLLTTFGGGKKLTAIARRNPTCASGFQMKLRTSGSGLLTAESKTSVCVLPSEATVAESWVSDGKEVGGAWRRWGDRIWDTAFEGHTESPSALLETDAAQCASGLAVFSDLYDFESDELKKEGVSGEQAAKLKASVATGTMTGLYPRREHRQRFQCVAPFTADTKPYTKTDWLAAGKPESTAPKSTWTAEPLSTFAASATASEGAACEEVACKKYVRGIPPRDATRLKCTRANDTLRASTRCDYGVWGDIERVARNPAVTLKTQQSLRLLGSTEGFVARTPTEERPRCNLDSEGACRAGQYRVICARSPAKIPKGVLIIDNCVGRLDAEADLKRALAPAQASALRDEVRSGTAGLRRSFTQGHINSIGLTATKSAAKRGSARQAAAKQK